MSDFFSHDLIPDFVLGTWRPEAYFKITANKTCSNVYRERSRRCSIILQPKWMLHYVTWRISSVNIRKWADVAYSKRNDWSRVLYFFLNIFTVVKSDGKDILGVWIRWVRRLYRILENDQDFRKKSLEWSQERCWLLACFTKRPF